MRFSLRRPPGAPAALLDAINSYDEYGVPGAANQGTFQYTGQVWLASLGLYHYKARVYAPTLGRFLQTDPVGYADQINLYAYVGNDPANGSDPSGLAEICTGTRMSLDGDGTCPQGGAKTTRRSIHHACPMLRLPVQGLSSFLLVCLSKSHWWLALFFCPLLNSGSA